MKPIKAASAVLLGSVFGLLSATSAAQSLGDVRDAARDTARGAQSAVSNPGRSADCAKGDTKVVRKIAKETVEHGIAKFKIRSNLYDAADVKRAEKDMYDFLNFKLGSPSAVCAQYITAGVKHFEKAYSDEAAAALMGHELPGDGRPKHRLPKRVSEQLKGLIRSCAEQVLAAAEGKGPAGQPASTSVENKLTAQALEKVSSACHQQVAKLRQQLEKDFENVPAELRDAAIKEISKAAVAGTKAGLNAGLKTVDRIAFDVPARRGKGFDIANSYVLKLIADRQAEKGAR